jgi:curved DNA-binding protein CbpA
LPATGEATDDDARAAWRRIAAATHPDRDDGGDPARFAAAAAAYATLRTSYDRGEALADLRTPVHHARHFGNVGLGLMPLGARVAVAAAVSAGAVLAAGWSPGAFGVLAGAATWVIAAVRRASGTP